MRLDQVRVQGFVVLDAPVGQRRSDAERGVVAALAERVLEGLVLYRLPDDKRARWERAGVQAVALRVTCSGL